MPLSIASTNEEKVTVIASPKTAAGNAAEVDGALRVTVQSGQATIEQDPLKPLEFKAVSGNGPGETIILVEADADLGAGVELISDLVTYDVTSAKATSFGLSAGAVEPK